MGPFPQSELISVPHELLCQVLSFLPVKDVLMMGMTCKKLATSVKIHLQLCKKLDLCDTEVWGSIPDSVSDDQLCCLLSKCPKLEALYGLRPQKIESRRLRKKASLSVLGVVDALLLCPNLKMVETNSFQILEALLHYLPEVEIVGHFRNEGGSFPPDTTKQLKMNQCPLITSLHLTGVFVPELTYMPELKDLHLLWVRFTRFEPFKSFNVPKLRSFVMKQCFGPDFPIRYMPLFAALSRAPNLERLECVRLPLPGGLIQRAVEESWDVKGFQNLKKLLIEGIKEIQANDIGHLMIAACRNLEHVMVTPATMSDNFFASLHFAGCTFTNLKTLCIATTDALWSKGSVSEFAMVPGTYNAPHYPMPIVYCEETSSITDRGVQIMGLLFPNCENLTLAHCPHLISCKDWRKENSWSKLRYLTLRHCYCLKTTPFEDFVDSLENIEVIILKEMFYETPKGCSNVGLSVGTGLGLSSAVVTTRDERLAVNVPNEPIEIIINPENDFLLLNNRNIGGHFQNLAHDPNREFLDDTDSDFETDDEFDKLLADLHKNLLVHYPNLAHNPPSKHRRKKRKSAPAEQAYSGPLTRNRERMLLSGKLVIKSNHCSQGTQTCYSIVRRTMSQAWCAPCNRRCQCNRSTNISKDYVPYKNDVVSSKSVSCDKSTSTNDPIYEEDKIQSLELISKSLRSLTIMSTGITSVHLYDTPALQYLEVQGCRVLKRIIFYDGCKHLSRINISSCPKFNFQSLLQYLQYRSVSGPSLFYFKPYLPRYSVSEMVETSLDMDKCDIFFVILFDYSSVDSNQAVYRENMLAWLNVLRNIIVYAGNLLMRKTTLNDIFKVEKHYSLVHRIYGEFPDASPYELLTNNPLLASLWRRYPNSIEICPTEEPSFANMAKIVSSLKEEIAEMAEMRHKYRNICLGCYIHMPE